MSWKSISVAGAVLAVLVAASFGPDLASAQQGAAADPGMVALTGPAEAITSRRLLMNAIGNTNDSLHDMLDGVLPWDDHVFQSRLLNMFAMFKAFPGEFRTAPDPWTKENEERDPARVSLALPSVWEQWDTFTALNETAAKTTLQAAFLSRAEAKPLVDALEAQCESCHQAFRKSFDDFKDFQDLPPATPAK